MKSTFQSLFAFGILAIACVDGAAAHSQSAPGKIAFVSTRDAGASQIYVMNSDGSNQTNLTKSGFNEYEPSFNSDGGRIAFASTRNGNLEIYAMNADGTNQTRLTSNPALDQSPVFSPDGTKIAFVSDRSGDREVYTMNADGSGQTKLTSNPSSGAFLGGDYGPAFSPDGTKILFESYHGNSYYDIDEMNVDGSGQRLLAHIAGDGVHPAFSPDGLEIVFGGANFANEVDIMLADGSMRTTLASGGYNAYSVFSPDGSRIALTSDRSRPATATTSGDQQIYIIYPDGSNAVRLTSSTTIVFPNFTFTSINYAPSWAPGSVPAPVSIPNLISLALSPSGLVGGGPSQGTVTLSGPAPAGGVTVILATSDPAHAAVPANVSITAGASSATFAIPTRPVTASTTVSLSASLGTVTKTAVLTLSAQPSPPAEDTVIIAKAEYTASKKQLQVQATSTNPNVTLQAYVTATGALIGTLTNKGAGKYEAQFAWPTLPQNITIKSSGGGPAGKAVTNK